VPDLAASPGVTGYAAGPDGQYIHIADGAAVVSFDASSRHASAEDNVEHPPGAAGARRAASASELPYVAQANGFIRRFVRRPGGFAFDFGSYYAPFVRLGNAGACRVSVEGKPVATHRHEGLTQFETPATEGTHVDYRHVEVDCES
jgi:hypothetical protein